MMKTRLQRAQSESDMDGTNEGMANGGGLEAMAGTQSSVTRGGQVAGSGPEGATAGEWQSTIKAILDTQKQMMAKMDSNHGEVKALLQAEVKKVREDVFLELSHVTKRLSMLEMRSQATPQHEPFAPDLTVILANLPLLANDEINADLMQKVQSIISDGLGLPGIEVVAVTRKAGRGRNPGLVLIELSDLNDKKEVLRAKMSLREQAAYKNLYLRSAEGHTDRLLRLNFQTLLDHLDLTNRFRFTGSGRLVPRDRRASQQGQTPHQNTRGAPPADSAEPTQGSRHEQSTDSRGPPAGNDA